MVHSEDIGLMCIVRTYPCILCFTWFCVQLYASCVCQHLKSPTLPWIIGYIQMLWNASVPLGWLTLVGQMGGEVRKERPALLFANFFFKSMLILPPWSKALWTLLSVLVSTLSSPLRAVLPEIFWGSRKLTIHLLYLLPRGTRSLSRKEERETLFPYLPVGWRGGSVCLGVGSG